ncbi:MAG: hypothetical protein KJ048_16215 [Dehalococcoidia bacterium]|nr:hypothetical protein [Dehalococcoidia bacterium]
MAFEFFERTRFVELRLFGEVSGATEPPDEWLARVAELQRLLIDGSEVSAITADVFWMAGVVNKARAYGPFWTAVFAPSDVVFGVLRQVSAYRADPAPTVDFFRERDAAEAWLNSREGFPAA